MKLRPITKAQIKYHKRESAKFIFVTDKEGNATCSRCDAELRLGKTKHLSMMKCPRCKKELRIQHTWRMSQKTEIISWMVVPKTIDESHLVLRFVLAYQKGNQPMEIAEKARLTISTKKITPEFETLTNDGHWVTGRGIYFRRPSWMMPNKYFCGYAKEYPKNFFEEINKLSCFKYYPVENDYDKTRIVSQLEYIISAAPLNEKLRKAGLNELANKHVDYYVSNRDKCYKYNRKETSLIKMLGLNQKAFECLKLNQSFYELSWMKANLDNINYDDYKSVGCDHYKYSRAIEFAEKVNSSFSKMAEYLENVTVAEYDHYLDTIKKLGYSLTDKYYSMPKDFAKADEKATDEYMAKYEKDKMEKLKKKDILIKKISDGIREMPNLREFLDGSNGLLVYVPESSKDLVREGKALHNCIGTYVDRVSEGKTLVFFVRQLNNPTAPFVAFEYHKGKVVQCRYDHNKEVDDDNIIQFVNKFADCLKTSIA